MLFGTSAKRPRTTRRGVRGILPKAGGTVADPIEERDTYSNLIHVLEDALEKAAEVLGPDVRASAERRAPPSTRPDRRL